MRHVDGVPEGAGPAEVAGPGRPGGRRVPPGPAVIGLGALVAVIAILLVVLVVRPATEPAAEANPTISGAPTPTVAPSSTAAASSSPTPEQAVAPTPTPPTASVDLAWARTAAFPAPNGLSLVEVVARIADRYVAIGVEYRGSLPTLGPTPPHHARAWMSADGRSWQPSDLGDSFENVRVTQLIPRSDGSLLALGERSTFDEIGGGEIAPAAWTTSDGQTWTEIDPPFAASARIERGARGMLAVVQPDPMMDRRQLWLSTDGIEWELVHTVDANYLDLGAGDEGFTAVGWLGDEDGTPVAIASADGRDWIEATSPGFSTFLEIAPLRGDWVVVDDPGGVAPTWFSANGLDWTAHGEVPFRTIELGELDCREYRRLVTSAEPWIVVTSELAYPCSEGGYVVHGTQYLSVDGASWHAIPLAKETVSENRSGSSVNDALATDAGLILVGEEHGAAAFWFGEAP